MTPSEINESVAKKLGWTRCNEDENGETFWHDTETLCTNLLPDYCQCIEAAWEIVECFQRSGMKMEFLWNGTWWICHPLTVEEIHGVDKTLPMAIYLAFLKLP